MQSKIAYAHVKPNSNDVVDFRLFFVRCLQLQFSKLVGLEPTIRTLYQRGLQKGCYNFQTVTTYAAILK